MEKRSGKEDPAGLFAFLTAYQPAFTGNGLPQFDANERSRPLLQKAFWGDIPGSALGENDPLLEPFVITAIQFVIRSIGKGSVIRAIFGSHSEFSHEGLCV